MKKTRSWALWLCLCALVALTGCACNHEWEEATCTEPKICKLCEATEGEALGHKWKEATCTEAKICEDCGETEGYALGHDWKEATCTEPKTCAVCGETEGKALGHDAKDMTCTENGTCVRCGKTVPTSGHDWKDATCTEPKTCSKCKKTDGKALGHTTKMGTCSRCGAELFEPIVNSGSGSKVVSNIELESGSYTVRFKHSGRSNFIVHAYDKDGDKHYLANAIGKYEGTVLLSGEGPFKFAVTADGSWEYKIEKLGVTAETSFSGKGDFVTPRFLSTNDIWHFKHDGKSNFVVWLYTTDGRDLIVNEIGKYDGEKVAIIPSGSMGLFEIEADGNWSIEPQS